MGFLIEIIRKPGTLDFLILTVALGVFLLIASTEMWPPLNYRIRALGIVIAGLGMAGILSMTFFGIEIRFRYLRFYWVPSLSELTNGYLQEPGQESTEKYITEKTWDGLTKSAGSRGSINENFPGGTWHDVSRWEGNSPKKTEIFYIPSHSWMIDWTTLPTPSTSGALSIKVYSADGTFIRSVAYVMGVDKDNALMKGSGNYYLVINANQKYKISVKAKVR